MERENEPALALLKRFLTPREKPRAGEVCEFCGEAVPDEHRHVVDLTTRGMRCSCRGCALLFMTAGAAGGRYRAVPERYEALGDAVVTDAQWDELQVPVALAFLFFSSAAGRVVTFYPGPAGAAESLLPVETWDAVLCANPVLSRLEHDVEALLVSKGAEGRGSYLVPIDVCYELVGRLKLCWKGFDGGEEARREIDAFFESVRSRCT